MIVLPVKVEHIFEINGIANKLNECFVCKTPKEYSNDEDCFELNPHRSYMTRWGQPLCKKCNKIPGYDIAYAYRFHDNIYRDTYYKDDCADFCIVLGCDLSDDEYNVKQILE